jgi:hypothetical protein
MTTLVKRVAFVASLMLVSVTLSGCFWWNHVT